MVSANFGGSHTKSASKSDPWAPTIPYLKDYLGEVGNLDTSGPTAGQTGAANTLKDIYSQGNPYAGQISSVANDTLAGVPSQSGQVGEAYGALKEQLTPYASGKNLDFKNNPYIQDMLANVSNRAAQQINAQYAASGRDPTGAGSNPELVSRGITEATLPILANLYSQQQANQLAAANSLYNAGAQTGQLMQGLDQSALAARAAGVPLAQSSLEAQTWAPQQLFNLEQTMHDIPANQLAQQGNLLIPVAQLGQQSAGTSKTNGWGFGVSLSDERYKEDLVKVGTLADGTPIYRFRYKGEDTVRIGVSAQDLEDITPEAVHEVGTPEGDTVKYVDLDAATRRSAMMNGNTPKGSLLPEYMQEAA